jgi:hypothetical protein
MMTKRESEKLIQDMKPELNERAAAWKCGAGLLIVWLIALIGVQTSLDPNEGSVARRDASASQVSAPAPHSGMVQTATQRPSQQD